MYVCSGNDLTFIEQYVPAEVQSCFDGYVLVTGCVLSDGVAEEIIIPRGLARMIHDLETRLRDRAFAEVKYFGRRLITITMFTRDEFGGTDPAALHPRVEQAVQEEGLADRTLVTHSDVAVDIIPRGFDKFFGLQRAGPGLKTIGVADSLNDIHLIVGADHAFLPCNASQKLIERVEAAGKRIAPLDASARPEPGVVYQSPLPSTRGVVDALAFAQNRLRG